MKRYISPKTDIVTVSIQQQLLAGSGGLGEGATLGNAYNGSDVTYSRRSSIWADEDEEEE